MDFDNYYRGVFMIIGWVFFIWLGFWLGVLVEVIRSKNDNES